MCGEEMKSWTKEIERQLEMFRSKPYVAYDRLVPVGKLLVAQFKVEQGLSRNELCPSLNEETIRDRIEKGIPILDGQAVCLDEGLLRELLEDIHLLPLGDPLEEAVCRLLSADAGGKILPAIVRRVFSGEPGIFPGLDLELDAKTAEGFKALALMLAAPFLRCCARAVRPALLLESITSRECPMCGGAPRMARLRQSDGKRLLECSECRFQWGFERLKCPYCFNEDQKALNYFFIEEETAYRLDTCEVCNRYIKTLDERKLAVEAPKGLFITDMATQYLDILAQKNNYLAITDGNRSY
jgi:FdhE protein